MDDADKGYENLANAVVMQAVDDYRWARATLKRLGAKARRTRKEEYTFNIAKRLKDDTEQFFTSTWFGVLSALDGKDLLKRLQNETGAPKVAALI